MKILSTALAMSMLFINTAPVFALGEVTVDTNVAPAPEPAPVSAPEPTPTLEPAPIVSTPSITEPTPEVNNVTAPVVETVTAGDTTPPHVSSVLAISVLPTEENIA